MRGKLGRGGPQSGFTHSRFRRNYLYTGFDDILEGPDNKYDVNDDDKTERSDSQCESHDDSHAPTFDLTRRHLSFDHRNTHPHQQRPFKPRRLGRGRASVLICENDFRWSRGNDKLWIEEDNEVRIWVMIHNTRIIHIYYVYYLD